MPTYVEVETGTDVVGLSLAREWPALLFMAILTMGLGIVVLVWPSETLTVVSVLVGIQLLLIGLFRLISAFAQDTASPGFAAFVGVLLLIAGVVVLRHPFETVEVLATILGVVWIVTGAIEVVDSIAKKDSNHRLLLALTGLISVIAGIVVVSWPAPTITVIAWIAGLYLLVFGIFVAATAFSLRSMVKTA